MSAPVYVGKHTMDDWCARRAVLSLAEVLHRQDAHTLAQVIPLPPSPRHYKPCPDCRDTGMRRVERPLVAGQWFGGSFTTGCHCAADPTRLMNAPAAATPSSAATVKAGGVATLTDGDTTQPDKAQR